MTCLKVCTVSVYLLTPHCGFSVSSTSICSVFRSISETVWSFWGSQEEKEERVAIGAWHCLGAPPWTHGVTFDKFGAYGTLPLSFFFIALNHDLEFSIWFEIKSASCLFALFLGADRQKQCFPCVGELRNSVSPLGVFLTAGRPSWIT